MSAATIPDWRIVAVRLWGILARRLTPQQIAALYFIGNREPTTAELAEYLGVSAAQAGNITRKLYDEGFLDRQKAGRSYRWLSAFPHVLTLALHRQLPNPPVTGEAAERAKEILGQKGQLT